jgi:3-hydroxyisobutyrate dehydrogenase-like beta-hydroxyacid dehydrogenase
MEAGYLCVGAMGQPTAHKLLDAGHDLMVYDINEAAMRPLLERGGRRLNPAFRSLASSLIQ